MTPLDERLNEILPILTSERFRTNKGLGNEVPFYAFDYPPEDELHLRNHIRFVVDQLGKMKPVTRVAHVHLFMVLLEILDSEDSYEDLVDVQRRKGSEVALKRAKGLMDPQYVADYIVRKWPVADHDVYLVEGVGSAYPLMRTHNLLNNLQPLLGQTPLVLFFPGKYDGQSLRLFGCLDDKPYYRAFRLVG